MTEILTRPEVQELPPQAEVQAECSVQDVVKILIGSFRFSQGDNLLQRSLLSLVAWNNRGRISSDIIEAAFPIARDAANKIIRNSQLHTATGDSSAQVSEFTNYFKNCLGGSPPDLSLVTRSVISRDYKFVVIRGGRNRSGGDRVTPANDPHLSHFINYGLLGNSTGITEYDEIFKQIADTYKEQRAEIDLACSTNSTYISELIDTYIIHHPEQADAVKAALASSE
jgi:hypothetical protein